MSSPTPKGFFDDKIPTFEEFISEEKLIPFSIDLNALTNGINSIPLYERLDIRKELLTDEELNLMNAEANKYGPFSKSEEIIIKNISDEDNIYYDEPETLKSEYAVDEEGVSLFLGSLFNSSINDSLITHLKQNVCYEENAHDLTLEVEPSNGPVETSEPSKAMSAFLARTNEGAHDGLLIPENISPNVSSSEDSCDGMVGIPQTLIKSLSSKIKFSGDSSEALKPIINAKKPEKNMVPESHSKKPVFPPKQVVHNESDSENDIDSKTITSKQTARELNLERKKGKRCRRSTKHKQQHAQECDTNKGKPNGSKLELPSGGKDKTSTACKHVFVKGNPEFKQVNQAKVPQENCLNPATIHKQTMSTSFEKKLNLKSTVPKHLKPPEISESSDEDWQDLADKSLYLRSKALAQKLAKKK